MTEKLYDNNSYLTEFEATVLDCENYNDIYRVVLDKTAFFPEEGGQCSDKGTLNLANVSYVQLKDKTIYHYCDKPFSKGEKVFGKIDFALRFKNMQNHSGEHILCGIIHKLYGFNNVGFHLGEDNVTMDIDGVISNDDISKVERLANEAIYKNMKVCAYYPADDELEKLDYRAKGDIKEDVRIVKIGDVDICACCAPHVKSTGEIGIIKILDAIKYKGGMRLSILSGADAVNHYISLHKQNVGISQLLSVKQEETLDGVKRLNDTISDLNEKLSKRTKQIAKMTIDSINHTDNNICLFLEDMEMGDLRLIANDVKEKTLSFGVLLSGDDEKGYKYVIASKDKDVLTFTKAANQSLNGKGGGKDNMTSGTFSASKDEILKYFNN